MHTRLSAVFVMCNATLTLHLIIVDDDVGDDTSAHNLLAYRGAEKSESMRCLWEPRELLFPKPHSS
jgi:hypothetical protein